ncbi:peptidoglycan-binding protein [Streptomyces sp. NPDC090025]|uniref:peptidoglycan-binding domain-containing protein n=1 Tax=Streptomyces sp. NPDC090025 TaxID=3365922 RepID=UPI00383624C9
MEHQICALCGSTLPPGPVRGSLPGPGPVAAGRHRRGGGATACACAATPAATPAAAPGAPPGPVFGKVAVPVQDTPGVRAQDIELFDATAPLPRIPAPRPAPRGERGRDGRGGRARHAHRAFRSEPRFPLVLGVALALGACTATAVYLLNDPPAPPYASGPGPVPVPVTAPPAGSATPPASPPAGTPTPPRTGRPTDPVPAGPSSAPPSNAATPVTAPSASLARRPDATRTARPGGPRPGHGRPEGDGTLRVGSTGPAVEDLQSRLQRLFLYVGSVDGSFDGTVAEALSRFQIARAIPERPGVYGPLTRAQLTAETG